MRTSDSTIQIVAALAKARQEFPTIHATGVNTAFAGSHYVKLDDILAVVPTLAHNGIVVVHSAERRDDGLVLCTRLAHQSGEWIEVEFPMSTEGLRQSGPQAVGSAVTYARRYSLQGLLAIVCDEDDDGNAAADAARNRPPKTTSQKAAAKAPPKMLSPEKIEVVDQASARVFMESYRKALESAADALSAQAVVDACEKQREATTGLQSDAEAWFESVARKALAKHGVKAA